jgi:hypothetical protein
VNGNTLLDKFKEAYASVPSQDNEGYVPERGSFKAGFFMGYKLCKKEVQDKVLELAPSRPAAWLKTFWAWLENEGRPWN